MDKLEILQAAYEQKAVRPRPLAEMAGVPYTYAMVRRILKGEQRAYDEQVKELFYAFVRYLIVKGKAFEHGLWRIEHGRVMILAETPDLFSGRTGGENNEAA